MNRYTEKPIRKKNPISKASWVSKFTFWWLKNTFKTGMKRPIEEDEIYEVTNSLRSDKNTREFAELWNEELKKPKPSIIRVIMKLHGFRLIFWGIVFSVLETLSRLVQPLCLGGLVSYFVPNQTEYTINDAYWCAGGIVLSSATMIVSFHPTILYIFKLAAKVRVGCTGLIYRKALRLSKSTTEDGISGKVINLISNDLAKFDIGFAFIHDVWKGPLESIVFGCVIYREIGISAVIGMAFLASFIPLQAWIGKKSAQLRLRTAKRTDFRVKIMNEIIAGIQVIKMYAWEKSFATMVDKIRKREVDAIRGIAYVRATITSFAMISKISIFLSLVSYIYLGNYITARKVFIVSSYFNILNLSMVYFWPVALTNVAETYISTKRLQEFLLKSEAKPHVDDHRDEFQSIDGFNRTLTVTTNGKSNDKQKGAAVNGKNNINMKLVGDENKQVVVRRHVNVTGSSTEIVLKNATAVWTLSDDEKSHGIFNVDMEVKPGLVCAIVGSVGAGKSTLLNVILGELELDDGSITVNGKLSYASQEPWLFEGTIRSNIVFVEEFDEKRYKEVCHVCALERDFRLLTNGDQTIVGERGVSLSGGQRARVNLARAIYKEADIFLLDDPLSAVDTQVGKHIFEKCIRDFLKNKIVVLVTHQLQYLQQLKHVVLMNRGRIEAQGSYGVLKHKSHDALMSLNADDEEKPPAETFETRMKKSSTASFADVNIVEEPINRKEIQAAGAVSFAVYKMFFKAVNSSFFVAIVMLMFVLAQLATSGSDYFVTEWVKWEENVAPDNVTNKINATNIFDSKLLNETNEVITNDGDIPVTEKRERFILWYAVIMGAGSLVYLYRSFSFFRLCLRVSINLHDKLFRGITRGRMFFFNNTPSGRILNRFARDISNIDTILPMVLLDVVDFILNLSAIIVIEASINYWLLVPTVVMIGLFYFLRWIYVDTARSIKRVEALTRSPVYSHMNATLQGLSTVRAFDAQDALEGEFHVHQDLNTSAWYLFICSTRWFALWLDLVCLLYIGTVTFSFLFLTGTAAKSGDVGLAILSSINLIGLCQWGMRQTAELENQMTSVERIVEYAEIQPEPPLESDASNAPPKDWPWAGNVAFKDLSLRYVENGARTLRNLSFHIEAKEKVGIVGRTGAGKSSMIQALFRLANNQGQILIDGIDIGVIGLHELRKKLSIIPQEPILFSGRLRFNLDPFGGSTDVELWDSLEQVELKTVISQMPGGLDCRILDGGTNLSVGQRQLVCLARAILRNNRVLILDEATANVDPETDKLIQETIRTKFADSTVLTIAHRLHTVMDYDKVLVMDAGEAVEFGHPFELIQKPKGFFKMLVDQTGSETSTALILAAKESYEKRKKDD